MYEQLLLNVQERAKEFDENITRVRTLNHQVLTRTEKLLSELSNLLEKVQKKDAPRKCTICFTRPITVCFVSCGHCLCENCAERCKAGRNKCFTCRQPITDIIKIFC